MRMGRFLRTGSAFFIVPALLLALASPGRPAAMPEIKVGTVLPLTGAFGSAGLYFRQGYQMAVDDVNNGGGLQVGSQKYHVTLIILDDASNGTQSRSLVEKLVTDQHVNFLLGGYDTSLVEAQEVVPDQYKIPYVEGGGAASDIFKRGYKYIFGTLATVYDMGATTADFLTYQINQSKLPKPLTEAVVYENTDHGKDYINALTDQAKAHPDLFKIVLSQPFQLNGSDFSPLLQQVKAVNAEAFLSDAHLPDFITMQREYLQLGLYNSFISYGARGPDQAGRKALGPGADYLIAALWWTPALKDAGSQLFTERYQRQFNATPDWFQALAFDTARVLFAGIHSANSLEGPAVRDSLARLVFRNALIPGNTIRFSASGQIAGSPYVVVQNTPGNTVRIVWPKNLPETRDVTLPVPRTQ
jgi:branched-chain amino acid transport system substrate-binding protein